MKKTVWLRLGVLAILAAIMVSLGCAQPVSTTEPTNTKPPSAPAVTPTPTPVASPTPTLPAATSPEEPQYGGKFTFRVPTDVTSWDGYFGGGPSAQLVHEGIGMKNWPGTTPDKWPFKEQFTPLEFYKGLLMESWETADFQTITFHVRKGVHWQNKAPLNGRELTASDFEYGYHRRLGLGSGFTKPSPYVSTTTMNLIVSVTATDKYTLVVKMKEPSFVQFRALVTGGVSPEPRESIDKWGDLNSWERYIGTGAFMITDYVSNSVISYSKNPNYWAFDEKYPKNRLPYVDKVDLIIIPDFQTALAAVRSGKVDMMDGINWEQAASLKKTNPEIVQGNYPFMANGVFMQIDKKPFDDIRVRKALQMALDLETIARTHYGGIVPGKPVGLTAIKGWRAEYNDWPQEVKDGYAYNPEGAKKLLASAGYPNGFKTTLTTPSSASGLDLDLLQIIKSYWADIGVDMTIALMDPVAFTPFARAGKAEMSSTSLVYMTRPPNTALGTRFSTATESNQTHIKDPKFDELWQKMNSALSEEEERKWSQAADLYAISQQWTVNALPTVNNNVMQPWVKGGYNPGMLLTGLHNSVFSRLWIDQGMKKAAGR